MEKMNRMEEMDKFLNYLDDIFSQNGELLSFNAIYAKLMEYGLGKESRKKISFDRYIETFKNVKNIQCREGKGFLHFENKVDVKSINTANCVKLYLSFKAEDMYDYATDIFKYLASKNIKHASKISDITRSDSICIRLFNMDDAIKLIQYINYDEKLTKAATDTNPFIFKEGVVGIAYDDRLSYNTIVASLMRLYFENRKDSESKDNVSLDSFKKFVANYYKQTFKNQKFENIMNNPDINKLRSHKSNGDLVLNVEEIVRLIYLQLDSNMDIEQFKTYYQSTLDLDLSSLMIKYYDDFINNKESKSVDEKVKKKIDERRNVLDSYIRYVASSQGLNVACLILEHYSKGEKDVITRKNDFRQYFYDNISCSDIKRLCFGNIKDYVHKLIESDYNYDYETKYNKVYQTFNKYTLFMNCCENTLKRYGYIKLITAINKCIKDKTFEGFPIGPNNIGNIRLLLEKEIDPNEVIDYCIKYLEHNDINQGVNKDNLASLFCTTLSNSNLEEKAVDTKTK